MTGEYEADQYQIQESETVPAFDIKVWKGQINHAYNNCFMAEPSVNRVVKRIKYRAEQSGASQALQDMSNIHSPLDSEMKCLDRSDALQSISIAGSNPEQVFKVEPTEEQNQLYIKNEGDTVRIAYGETSVTASDMTLSDGHIRDQMISTTTSSVVHPVVSKPRPRKLSNRRASGTVSLTTQMDMY